MFPLDMSLSLINDAFYAFILSSKTKILPNFVFILCREKIIYKYLLKTF